MKMDGETVVRRRRQELNIGHVGSETNDLTLT